MLAFAVLQIDYVDNFKVKRTSKNISDLRILETWHIFKRRPKLNDLNMSDTPLSIVNK